MSRLLFVAAALCLLLARDDLRTSALSSGRWGARVVHPGAVEFSWDGRPQVTLRAEVPPGAVEEVSLTPTGFEQQWRFERRPPAPLRVTVESSTGVARTPRGLRLEGADAPLWYGAATWVDARGRRTPIAQRVVGAGIVMEVPDTVLSTTEWPAVLDPAISPELPVGPVGTQRAWNWQGDAVSAFDGLNTLVVWVDEREDSGDLYFGRVSPAGVLRDAYSAPLARGPGAQHSPAVASGAGVSLVAWVDERAGASDLRMARVSPAGQVLDATGVSLTSTPWNETRPAVAFDGSQFLVAWLDARSPPESEVYGVRVSPLGMVLDASPVRLTTAPGTKSELTAAATPTGFVLAWVDSRASSNTDLYAARVSSALVAQDAAGVLIDGTTNDVEGPFVSVNGNAALVTWTRLSGTTGDTYAAHFDLGAAPSAPFALSTNADWQYGTWSAPDGAGWLVSWLDAQARRFFVHSVSAGGALGPEVLSDAPGYGTDRHMLWADPTNVYAVQTGNDHITFGAWARATGANVTSVELPTSSESQVGAVMAALPPGVVLVDVVGGQSLRDPYQASLILTPLNADGTTRGPATNLWDRNGTYGCAVASNGSNALVVFSSYWSPYELFGRRVQADGQPLEVTEFSLTAAGRPTSPRVATDGTDYLAVWHDQAMSPLFFGRVTSAGALLDPGGRRLVEFTTGWQLDSVDVAFDGQRYLTAWRLDDDRGGSTVSVAHVTTSGVVVEDGGLLVGGSRKQWDPALGSGPGVALLTWADERQGTLDIYAARFFADGGMPDLDGGLVVFSGVGGQYEPTVTFDGARFLIAWVDDSSGATTVGGNTLTPDGVVGTPFVFESTPGSGRPRLVSVGGGRSLLSSERFTFAPPIASVRTYVRAVGAPLTVGARCADATECASGFCVDGVCCDAACGGGAVDCQACTAALGATVDGTCTTLAAGRVCRSARSVCDLAETCGGATTCPPDETVDDGTTCGTGVCFAGNCETAQPTDGGRTTDAGAVGPPAFVTEPPALASCNRPWSYQPALSTSVPASWRLRGVAGALPERLFINSETGEVFWRPSGDDGAVTFDIVASTPTGAVSQRVEVEVSCAPVSVGCACGSTPLALLGAAAAWLLRRARRRLT